MKFIPLMALGLVLCGCRTDTQSYLPPSIPVTVTNTTGMPPMPPNPSELHSLAARGGQDIPASEKPTYGPLEPVIVNTNGYHPPTNTMTLWADALASKLGALHYVAPNGELLVDGKLYAYLLTLDPHPQSGIAEYPPRVQNPPLWSFTPQEAERYRQLYKAKYP